MRQVSQHYYLGVTEVKIEWERFNAFPKISLSVQGKMVSKEAEPEYKLISNSRPKTESFTQHLKY